jgi:two-component system chemotaxis response regulator CheB
VRRYDCVVIGASAGGIAALKTVTAPLPARFPLPIVVVQHVRAGTTIDYMTVFGHPEGLAAKEAEDKEPLRPGMIYVAPPGYHVLVERSGQLALAVDPPVNFSRPSIDVLFETAAEAFGARLVGVVLTGANADGALGLRAVKNAGGLTIVEDPATAAVRQMPEAALREAEPDLVLPVEKIAALLVHAAAAAVERGPRTQNAPR